MNYDLRTTSNNNYTNKIFLYFKIALYWPQMIQYELKNMYEQKAFKIIKLRDIK